MSFRLFTTRCVISAANFLPVPGARVSKYFTNDFVTATAILYVCDFSPNVPPDTGLLGGVAGTPSDFRLRGWRHRRGGGATTVPSEAGTPVDMWGFRVAAD